MFFHTWVEGSSGRYDRTLSSKQSAWGVLMGRIGGGGGVLLFPCPVEATMFVFMCVVLHISMSAFIYLYFAWFAMR